MADFKIGDQVEILDVGEIINRSFVGLIGKITDISVGDQYPYKVTFLFEGEYGDDYEYYQEEQLRLAYASDTDTAEDTAFKDGDRVLIIGPKDSSTGYHVGWDKGPDAFAGKVGYVFRNNNGGLCSAAGNYCVAPDPGRYPGYTGKLNSHTGYYGQFPAISLRLIVRDGNDLPSPTAPTGDQIARNVIKETIMNIVDKARTLVQSPERKRRLKYGIEDTAGNRTTEGTALMTELLWADPDMQKRIDAKLLEVEKADEADRKASK
jgi:hypothetical protein